MTQGREVVARVDHTLRGLRETLHAHGRLSNRNEALDEVAVLLYAHAMGPGIRAGNLADQPGRTLAERLSGYVAAVLDATLPRSLAHEMSPADFRLRLKPQENDLAGRIVGLFDELDLTAGVGALGMGALGVGALGVGALGAGALGVDVLNEAFGRFLAHSFVDEKELGQYLTPPEVVDFMVRLALRHLTPAERQALVAGDFGYVLDPSCGVGSFLAEFIRLFHEETTGHEKTTGHEETTGAPATADPGWPARAAAGIVVGIDKSERMVRLALANLALFGAPAARLHLANALDSTGPGGPLSGAVGLILTNPPFGATFQRAEVTGYRLADGWPSRPQSTLDSELLFMERYVQWLRPGGQLLAVVPDSILTNKGIFADLRRALAGSVDLLDVVSLPVVTFAAAGTTTKTSIVHLRRTDAPAPEQRTRFAVCTDLGYVVSTRDGQRTKAPKGTNQLPALLDALTAPRCGVGVREVLGVVRLPRWDATYHASLSENVHSRLAGPGVRVGDCALLVNDRVDPRRYTGASFRYIEISDVDPVTQTVTHKEVAPARAPSRARLLVHSGDVLVSTVRPERGAVGVVPPWLSGAVCTTGFAVLRPKGIDGIVLAALLRTEFVVEQLLRNNVGIAYPAIEPACLPDVLLPIARADIDGSAPAATGLAEARSRLLIAQEELDRTVAAAVDRWHDGTTGHRPH